MSLRLARMLAESLVMQLASCPEQLCGDALQEGMHPRLVAGLVAARNAFAEHVSENDVEELVLAVRDEVTEGLKRLEGTK